jgi:hypothetical protein
MLKNNPFLTIILAICIFLTPFYPVLAEPISDQKDETIGRIIEKSGIQGQLAAISALFNGKYLKTGKEKKKETERSERIEAIFQENFTAENLLPGIKQILLKQYNDKNAQEVLKFYDSELGARIAQCAIASADPAFTEKTEGFDIENYDRKRRQIVNRLFNDMKILSFQSEINSIILELIFRSVNASVPKETRSADADIIQMLKQLKSLTHSMGSGDNQRTVLINDYYIMYEAITTDELVEYDKFVKSKSGKWMTECVQTGMVKGLHECIDKMVIDLTAYTDSHPRDEAEETETEEPGDI